jgi:proline-specific peptidase
MKDSTPVEEGYLPFRSHKIWYRRTGQQQSAGKLPVLCLHGGPGASHDYLEPLEELASTGRQVILYDQLGGGDSDHPHDPSLWTVPLFVEELGVVRSLLRLDRVHLYGQSWGGMLAMEYMLTKPKGIASMTVSSSPASMRQWVVEANRLRAELPADVQATLLKHEEAGTTKDPAYQKAMMVFYQRHLCRLDPWPEELNRTFSGMMHNAEVYNTMNGPSEFHVIGNLKDWDITHRLGEIDVPTLVLSGRYDEATPAIAETVHRGIRGSEWVIFENSSHGPHLEERERHLQVLAEFLERLERNMASRER